MSISQLTTNDRLRAAQAASALRSNAAYAAPATQAPTRQPDAVSLSDSARALYPFFGRVFGADSLGCIFNDGYTVACANRLDFVHRAAQAEQMDRNDRFNLQPSLGPNLFTFENALRGEELV